MPKKFLFDAGMLGVSRVFLAVSQIAILPIVARLLSIEDFALVALAMTIVIFTTMLSDAGLARSLTRVKTYKPLEWSSVFWLLVGVGTVLMLFIIAMAPVLSWYYGEPKLFALTCALSLIPFFLALGAVPAAELERREEFTTIAMVQIMTTCASLATAVTMAYQGFGAWALVAQQLVFEFARLIGVFWFSKFRPTFEFDHHALKGHLGFGRDTIGVSFTQFAIVQSSILVIAKSAGAVPLGLFAMAQRLLRLPEVGIAGAFSTPIFVKMARAHGNRKRLGELYVATTRIFSILVIPPLALIAASAEATITVVLSHKWLAVAPLFVLAAPGVALEVATSGAGNLLMATGHTTQRLKMMVERMVLWLVFLAVALQISIAAVMLARTIWVVTYMPRFLNYAAKCADIDMTRFMAAIGIPTVLSALAWIGHVAIASSLHLSDPAEMFLAITLTVLTMATVIAVTWSSFKHDLGMFDSTQESPSQP